MTPRWEIQGKAKIGALLLLTMYNCQKQQIKVICVRYRPTLDDIHINILTPPGDTRVPDA